ncbi:hypothetical protein EOM39_00175 [Candidatus Gracilibacteria bacterium]|nr:hypothetical protein [Candidatus Gracilibacteria bacterium]
MKIYVLFFIAMLLISSCANNGKTENKTGLDEQSGKNKEALVDSGSVKKEEPTKKQVIKIIPVDLKVVENLINSGSYKEAEERLKKESEISKDNPDILRLMGRLAVIENNYSGALDYLNKANELTDWKNKNLLYDIGVIYSVTGDLESSEKNIKKALEIDPGFKFAKDYLKVIEEQRQP